MIVVFFIYGLAFFILGTAIAVYPKKDSAFPLARHIRFIAAFGFVHGAHEWLEMFELIYGKGRYFSVELLSFVSLPFSFMFLVMFGSRLIRATSGESRILRFLPWMLLFLWALTTALSANKLSAGIIFSRYLIAVPGVSLSFTALLLQKDVFKKAGYPAVSAHLNVAAWAFLFYGFFAGVVVPKGEFFPASVLNHASFRGLTGLPVQVFRATCALFIAYGMWRILGIFDWETRKAIIKSRDDLESRVGERTAELKDAKEKIELSLEENKMLLSEIHHRTKNNLQLVSSLLNLQSRYTEGEALRDMLKEIRNRVYSMTLVHETLYDSGSFSRVNFGDYLKKIVNELMRSYETSPGRIETEINAENIMLPIDTANPIGLIINELLTNSIKHAFPGDMKGKIWISLRKAEGDAFELTVRDDGIGLPDGIDIGGAKTLGLRLVTALVNQLKGSLSIDTTNKTEFIIKFELRR